MAECDKVEEKASSVIGGRRKRRKERTFFGAMRERTRMEEDSGAGANYADSGHSG